ncbi:GntR family transcriptional regulator [Paraliobacillus sp. JSM ZJ581]|uniref:GntR family transcriptional regulator n=1 Tax=Paraliobacillus sp. JSM ZJ581 TaxID=3342118 RepID=UPI0035A96BF8
MSIETKWDDAFQKLSLAIKQDIENNAIQRKKKLPSVLTLAERYGVSKQLMKAVLQQLMKDQIILNRAGVGLFVNSQPIFSSGIEQLGSVTQMISNAGKTPGTQYVSAEIVEPDNSDLKHFQDGTLGNIAKIERVRTADREPVVYCIDKVDHKLMPMEQIHSKHSIFQLLEDYSNKKITYAVAFIEPISFDSNISPILNCQPDQALLLLKQIHYTESDEPILISENYFRPDVFQFYVVRRRI